MAYYHANSSLLAPGSVIEPGNWGRILRHFGPRHNLWLRETALEHVRVAEFPANPSRLAVAFFFDNEQTARLYRDQHMEMGVIYEVEPTTVAPIFRANFDAVSPDYQPSLDWCRRYWLGDIYPVPGDGIRRTELLSKSPLRILRQI